MTTPGDDINGFSQRLIVTWFNWHKYLMQPLIASIHGEPNESAAYSSNGNGKQYRNAAINRSLSRAIVYPVVSLQSMIRFAPIVDIWRQGSPSPSIDDVSLKVLNHTKRNPAVLSFRLLVFAFAILFVDIIGGQFIPLTYKSTIATATIRFANAIFVLTTRF